MRTPWLVASVLALISTTAIAQTISVACTNDYSFRVGGLGIAPAGTGTACDSLVYAVPSATPITLTVETGFGFNSIVVPLFAVGRCVPETLCLPDLPILCANIPPTLGPCPSNRTLDLDLATLFDPGFSGPTTILRCQSTYERTFSFPPALFGAVLSTQAIILPVGPPCHPFPYVMTEAFNFVVI